VVNAKRNIMRGKLIKTLTYYSNNFNGGEYDCTMGKRDDILK